MAHIIGAREKVDHIFSARLEHLYVGLEHWTWTIAQENTFKLGSFAFVGSFFDVDSRLAFLHNKTFQLSDGGSQQIILKTTASMLWLGGQLKGINHQEGQRILAQSVEGADGFAKLAMALQYKEAISVAKWGSPMLYGIYIFDNKKVISSGGTLHLVVEKFQNLDLRARIEVFVLGTMVREVM